MTHLHADRSKERCLEDIWESFGRIHTLFLPRPLAFCLRAFTQLFLITAPKDTFIPPLWLFIYILGNQYLLTASQYMMGCIILIARVSFLSILHRSTLKAESCQPV